MSGIPCTKPYREASDAFQKLLKNVERREIQEVEQHLTIDAIELIGDFERFDLDDMDTWGGRMRFIFRDMEAKTEEEQATRGELAMQVPELAALFTAKTILLAYKEERVTVCTTIIVETIRGGRCVDRKEDVQSEETTEWVDVSREFARRGLRNFGWKD